ncbi:MAG: hypothetical protein V1850_07270, partial [Candidatus Bathyarchaeota archaeon]
VLLESPALATTKELIKVGVKADKIYIPNHTDSYEAIIRNHPASIVFPLTLGKFFKLREIPKLGMVFADYCGTLDGDALTTPSEDIKDSFIRGLYANKALLGVTIAKRNPNKPNNLVNNDISRLNSVVTQNAWANGYSAIDLGEGRSYHNSSMYFVLYGINKL